MRFSLEAYRFSYQVKDIVFYSYFAKCFIMNGYLIFFFINLFIFGCVGSSLLHAGFLWLRRAGATLLLRCADFSLLWLLLLRSTGSRHAGFSSCGLRALEHRLGRCGAWA